ncbi:DUF935 domain-containing protein [uncultured Shewanella sp.]|uniref:DUF935 domain-containing protein n=1 Tax=uncultured Shewanella sp. TaxID=173975 RepID=UPI002613A889|nr:DUF935 domain-containing protein [uncultured Shewanella sp.]
MQERVNKDKQIVDRFGRPFERQAASEYQTDDVRLVGLKRTFSEHPSSGLTPARAAEILLAAEQGDLIAQCELAEDLEEKDGHLYAELDKRKRALLGVDHFLKPPRNASAAEIKDTEYLSEMLFDTDFLPTLIKNMADAMLKGFSLHELTWSRKGREWFVNVPEYRDPAWFMTHPERRNELRLRDGGYEGAELQAFGWINHVHAAKSGYVGRAGLIRQLVWPFIFKNYSVRDLAEFLEIYGLPLRIGQYPSGATNNEKRALLQAVTSIGHNAGGIMPKGMVMDFHAAANGHADPFDLMIQWGEKTMSKVILGGTLTSQADGKSSTNALGNVHNEVREELRNSDLAQLAETLSRDLVYPLYALNCKSHTSPRRAPRFVFDTQDGEDLTKLAAPLKTFVSLGMQVPQKWLHDKTRIPEPSEGEAVLQLSATTQPSESNKPINKTDSEDKAALVALAANSKAPSVIQSQNQAESELDIADVFAIQLKHVMSPVINHYIEQIQQIVDSADSLEAIASALQTLDLPLDDASEVMRMAFVAAELAGRNAVEEEAAVEEDA